MVKKFNWDSWSGEPEKKSVKPVIAPEDAALPWMIDKEAWEQYSDIQLYVTDKWMRKWLLASAKTAEWSKNQRKGIGRSFLATHIFERMYGRKFDQFQDRVLLAPIILCCRWYATKIVRDTTINGYRHRNKNVYVFGVLGLNNEQYVGRKIPRRPYSLKLRYEFFLELGIIPNGKNMKIDKHKLLGKDKLSRFPKTEANRRLRSQRAREREITRREEARKRGDHKALGGYGKNREEGKGPDE